MSAATSHTHTLTHTHTHTHTHSLTHTHICMLYRTVSYRPKSFSTSEIHEGYYIIIISHDDLNTSSCVISSDLVSDVFVLFALVVFCVYSFIFE